MIKRIGTIILLAGITAFLTVVTDCSGDTRLLRTRDGKAVTFETMLEDIRNVKVVFLGETHDSRRDHEFQLAIIKALQRSGAPLAIGLEMFRAESQRVLDQWIGGRLELKQFLKAYDDNWGVAWPLYRDIFLYSRDNRIPMIGLNAPADITRKVSREGFSSLTPEELRKLPPGISCNVDERYMEFIRRAYGAHDVQGRSFVNFCEAQMVWDRTMAWHLSEFRRKNPEKIVVVLAGVGHSWKRGIPEQMEDSSKDDRRVILPEIPERIDRDTVLSQDADYILLR